MSSILDIASAMEDVINSDEHQSLFDKFAAKKEDKKSSKKDKDDCGSMQYAKDKPVKSKKEEDKEDKEEKVKEEKPAKKAPKSKKAYMEDAIAGLIKASEALDEAGFDKAATVTVHMAELISIAKKNDSKDLKGKNDAKAKELLKKLRELNKVKGKAEKEMNAADAKIQKLKAKEEKLSKKAAVNVEEIKNKFLNALSRNSMFKNISLQVDVKALNEGVKLYVIKAVYNGKRIGLTDKHKEVVKGLFAAAAGTVNSSVDFM